MKQVKSRNLQRFLAFFLSLVLLMGALPVFAADDAWKEAKQDVLRDKAAAALVEIAQKGFPMAVRIQSYTMPEEIGEETSPDDVPTAEVAISVVLPAEEGESEKNIQERVRLPIGTYTFGFDAQVEFEGTSWDVINAKVNGEEPAAVILTADDFATISYELFAPEQGQASSLDPFVTKITLTHNGEEIDLTDGAPALENAKNGDKVTVAYEFAIKNPTQEGFAAKVPYPVTIPQKNFTYDMANKDVEIKNDDGHLATFHLDQKNKTASFTFVKELTELDTNVTGSFSYSGKLALSGGEDGDQLIFSIEGKEIKVPISTGGDVPGTAGKTEKMGKYLPETGEIRWTITVTPPEDGIIPAGLTLTDKMFWGQNGTKDKIHELSEVASVKIQNREAEMVDLDTTVYTLTRDDDNHGFTLKIDETLQEVRQLEVEYTSKLSKKGLAALNAQSSGKQDKKTVHNKVVTHNASVEKDSPEYSWGEASANVKFDFWMLQKTLVEQKDGVATWRLFVNKNFVTMPKGVQIIDTPQNKMTYDKQSLKVYVFDTQNGTDPSEIGSYTAVTAGEYITASVGTGGKVTFELVNELKVPMIIELKTKLPGTFDDQTEFKNTAQLVWDEFGATVSASTGKLNSSTIRKGDLGFHLPLRAAGWNVYLGQTDAASTIVDTIGANQKLIAADATLKKQYADNATITLPGKEQSTTLKAFYKSIFDSKVEHNMSGVTNGLTTIYLQRIKEGNVADVTWQSKPDGNAIALPLDGVAAMVEDGVIATASYDATTRKLTVTFSGPLKYTYRLRYWTAVDDEAIYGAADQEAADLSNTPVDSTDKGTKDNLPAPKNSITLTVGADQTYTASTTANHGATNSQFEKSVAQKYDAETGTIIWELNANRWSLPYQNGFTVRDMLPEGHSLPTYTEGPFQGGLDKSEIEVTATGPFATSVTYAEGVDYLLEKNLLNKRDVLTVRFIKPIYTGVRVKFPSTITEEELAKQMDAALDTDKTDLIWTNNGEQRGTDLSGKFHVNGDTAKQEINFMPVEKSGSRQDDQKDLIKWTITLNKGFLPVENTNGKTITDTLHVTGLPEGVTASEVVSEPQDVTLKVQPASDKAIQSHTLKKEPSTTESWYAYDPETLTMTVYLVTPYNKGEYDRSQYYLTYNTQINVPQGLENTKEISVNNEASWYGKDATAKINSIKISEVQAAVDWTQKGRLTVTKFAANDKDEHGNPIPDITKPLSGARIEVYNTGGEYVAGQYTQSDGTAKFILDPGFYIVKEVAAPRGYVVSAQSKAGIPAQVYAGDTTSETNFLHIGNERITGGITVEKYEMNTDGTLNNDFPLEGAVFGLYAADAAADAEPLDTQETDEDGIATFGNLPYGKYVVREISAPAGYHLNSNVFEVDVKELNKFYTVEVGNEPIVGSLLITKVSEVGNYALAGAAFELLAADKTTVVRSGETDVNGWIIFDDLRLGTYYLRETKAPSGYVANTALIEVEITEEHLDYVTHKVVTNRAETPENPDNPDNPTPPTPPTPDTPVPDNEIPTGGGTRRVIVDTTNLTPEQVEQLIEDGFVPLSDLPNLTPEEIIDNQIPLAYIPPTEVPLASAEPVETDGTPHTGDNTPLALMLMLMAASAAGLVVLRKRRV